MRANIVHVLFRQSQAENNPHMFELAKMLCAMQRKQQEDTRQRAH